MQPANKLRKWLVLASSVSLVIVYLLFSNGIFNRDEPAEEYFEEQQELFSSNSLSPDTIPITHDSATMRLASSKVLILPEAKLEKRKLSKKQKRILKKTIVKKPIYIPSSKSGMVYREEYETIKTVDSLHLKNLVDSVQKKYQDSIMKKNRRK